MASSLLLLLLLGAVPSRGSLQTSLKGTSRAFFPSIRGGGNGDEGSDERRYRTVHVQIIHRHGDRTPITTMKNSDYWASTLVENSMLEKISEGTTLKRNDHDVASGHNAQGRGPYGKLTMVGLLQMIDLGISLRDELEFNEENESSSSYCETIEGSPHCPYVCMSQSRPLSAETIEVVSTDFARTIQSVQGFLVGMFPDGITGGEIEIDCRHTSWMIPDPQPRATREQELLEVALSRQPHILERESTMRPLAVRVTQELREQLDDSAFHMSYGVGEDEGENDDVALPWAQLSEVTKCLKVRDMLPESITPEDQETIVAHTAWRWFESMKDARLCYLSMHRFCSRLVDTMCNAIESEQPPVVLYSAHDSTLIGTLCSMRLEQPSVWPRYASYLKIELIHDENCKGTDVDGGKRYPGYYVRFVFNGKVLASKWRGESQELIPLDELANYIATEGSEPTQFADKE